MSISAINAVAVTTSSVINGRSGLSGMFGSAFPAGGDLADVFLNLAGTADAVITPTILNNSTVGANPGTWSFGAAKHDGSDVNPVSAYRHTLLRTASVTLDPAIICNGTTYSSVTRAVEFDQDTAPTATDWETIPWAPGVTVDGNILVDFIFEMDRTLGADSGGTSVDVCSIYYGGLFAVAQQKIDANGTDIYMRSHNGGTPIPIANSTKYRVWNYADKGNQQNIVVVFNQATGAFVGAGQSPFLVDSGDTLTFVTFGDYLANGDGQGRVYAPSFRYNSNATVLPSFTVPVVTSLSRSQTDTGTVGIVFSSQATHFKIERSSNAGSSWSTLNAAFAHTATTLTPVCTYTDATAVDATTYLYRISPIVGPNTGASQTTSSITIDDAPFATPTWTDVIDLTAADTSETNGAAWRQPIVCGTTGSCTRLRVGRRGGGSTPGFKMALYNSSNVLLGSGTTLTVGTDGTYVEVMLDSPVSVTSGTTYKIAGMPSTTIGIHAGYIGTGGSSMVDFSTLYAAFPPDPYSGSDGVAWQLAVGMGVV